MVDLEPYLSLRGHGVNCWNVVESFYLGELGIQVENYDDVIRGMPTPSEYEDVRAAWFAERAVQWVEVPEPCEFDLIDMWVLGMPHVAIHIRPVVLMHKIGLYTQTQDYRSENWQRRIRGYYRHPSRI